MKEKPSNEELLDDLRQFAEEIENSPSAEQMDDTGPHNSSIYRTRFGSWNNALSEAGLEPNKCSKISTDEIITAVKELAADVRGVPSSIDMDRDGRFSPAVCIDRFGSWDETLEAAGLDPDQNTAVIDDEPLLEELRRLTDVLGHPPSLNDLDEQGKFSKEPYFRAFDGFEEAIAKAGLDRTADDGIAPDDQLLSALASGAINKGGPLSRDDILDFVLYHPSTYRDRFGSIEEAHRLAGIDPETDSYLDVGDLLAEFRHAEAVIDSQSHRSTVQRSKYPLSVYTTVFGSIEEAAVAAEDVPPEATLSFFDGPDDRILDEIRKVGVENRCPPIPEEVEFSVNVEALAGPDGYSNWNKVLEEAGFDIGVSKPQRRVSDDELISDIERVADVADRFPHERIVRRWGIYPTYEYKRRFGQWGNALLKTDLDIPDSLFQDRIPDQELIEDVQRLADDFGRRPTGVEIDEFGEFSITTYVNRFGSVSGVWEAAGLDDPDGEVV